MSHQDNKELTKEELAAQGIESDNISLLANVGIFLTIFGTLLFVVISGVGVWNFMADALTREIDGKSSNKKASMLEDGKVNALVALAKHKASYGDATSFKVNAGKLSLKKVKDCGPGSAILCDTVMYRRNQKLLVLQGGKSVKGVTVLPISTGMKRLLAKPSYLNAVTDQTKAPVKKATAPAPKKPASRGTAAVKNNNTKKAAPSTRPAVRR